MSAKYIVKKKCFSGLYKTSYMHTAGIRRGDWKTVAAHDGREEALRDFEIRRKVGLDKWAVFHKGKAVVTA